MGKLSVWVRQSLLRTLGLRNYLLVVSRVYLVLVRLGLVEDRYPELFALDRFIDPGAHCIDIGANLGYYTVRMSRLTGPKGRVWAVEPVQLFREVLRRNLALFAGSNVEVVPYALGSTEKSIVMGTPSIEGVVSHGRTRIVDADDRGYVSTHTGEMRVADRLFQHLERLDFVKCDVEGHEPAVFRSFTKVIDRCRPVVQVEVSSAENRAAMIDLFAPLDYSVGVLERGEIRQLTRDEFMAAAQNDFYFFPA